MDIFDTFGLMVTSTKALCILTSDMDMELTMAKMDLLYMRESGKKISKSKIAKFFENLHCQ